MFKKTPAWNIPAPQPLNSLFHCVYKNLIILLVALFISFISKKDRHLNLNLPDKTISFYYLLKRGKVSLLCCHLYLEVRRRGGNCHSASTSTSCLLFLLALFKWPPYLKVSVILKSGLFLVSLLPFTVLQGP